MRKAPLWMALAWLAIVSIGLDRYPLPSGDEVALNAPARALVFEGRWVNPLFERQPGWERGYFWQPPGGVLATAACYAAAGFGVWQTRLAAVLFGAGTIALVGRLAQRTWRSDAAGAWAALLLALNPVFGQTACIGRMDTQCMFWLLLATWWLVGEEAGRRPWRAGLCLGLAGLAHPLAALWAPALVGWRVLLSRAQAPGDCLRLAAGAASVAGLWVAYGLLWQREAFIHQFLHHGASKLAGVSLGDRFGQEALRWWESYRPVPFLPLAYAAGVLWLGRAAGLDRGWRWGAGGATLLILLLNTVLLVKGGGPYHLYPALLLTIFAGGAIAAAVHWEGAVARRMARGVVAVGAGLLLARFAVPRVAALGWQWEARDPAVLAKWVAARIPRNAEVGGSAEVWYAVAAAGAHLRTSGGIHDAPPGYVDYWILASDHGELHAAEFRWVAALDCPLPRVWGRDFSHMPWNFRLYRRERPGAAQP